MKKRAKLITTIASLCLAVALMAFGVYAATSVTVSITSQISFSVADVFVDVSGSARLYDTTEVAGDVTLTPYTTHSSYETDEHGVKRAGSGTLAAWEIKMHGTNDGENVYTATPAYDNDHDGVEYVITIDNVSTSPYYVSFSSDALPAIEYTTVSGSYKVATASNIASATATSCVTNNVISIAGVTLPAGQRMVITLNRVLTDYSRVLAATTSLNGTLTVNFSAPAQAQAGD